MASQLDDHLLTTAEGRKVMSPRTSTKIAFVFVMAACVGCSAHDSQRYERREESRGSLAEENSGSRTTTVVEREVRHEQDSDVDQGLFGIIGNIIALPFRAIGGLFRAIF